MQKQHVVDSLGALEEDLPCERFIHRNTARDALPYPPHSHAHDKEGRVGGPVDTSANNDEDDDGIPTVQGY